MYLNIFEETMKSFITKGAQDTKLLARKLSAFLTKKDVVALVGELGSGKTTFIKGLALGLGIDEDKVISPSFVLIRQYGTKPPLYHFDLYRLNYIEEVELLGYKDYFYGDGITCIEWADKIENLLPDEYLKINFDILGNDERKITFYAKGAHFRRVISKIK